MSDESKVVLMESLSIGHIFILEQLCITVDPGIMNNLVMSLCKVASQTDTMDQDIFMMV